MTMLCYTYPYLILYSEGLFKRLRWFQSVLWRKTEDLRTSFWKCSNLLCNHCWREFWLNLAICMWFDYALWWKESIKKYLYLKRTRFLRNRYQIQLDVYFWWKLRPTISISKIQKGLCKARYTFLIVRYRISIMLSIFYRLKFYCLFSFVHLKPLNMLKNYNKNLIVFYVLQWFSTKSTRQYYNLVALGFCLLNVTTVDFVCSDSFCLFLPNNKI